MFKIIDYQIIDFLVNLRNPSLTLVFKSITFLGDISGLLLGVLTVMIILFLTDKYYFYKTKIILSGILIAGVVQFVLKIFFSRARPDQWPALLMSTGFSFPSGHTTVVTVVYGLLIYFLAKSKLNWKLKKVGIFLVSGVIILVGVSRIYLGVHWPSDVFVGWILGLIILLGLVKFFKK